MDIKKELTLVDAWNCLYIENKPISFCVSMFNPTGGRKYNTRFDIIRIESDKTLVEHWGKKFWIENDKLYKSPKSITKT